MKGDEERIIVAFCLYLEHAGWAVEREVEFVDVVATRGGDRIYAEAKGKTAAPGLDVDTMYGQLLRRMPPDEVGYARFAVVVPSSALSMALRVPERVRELLAVDVYAVDDDGTVERSI